MKALDSYASVVVVLSIALLLIAARKEQLVWKRPRALPVRRRP